MYKISSYYSLSTNAAKALATGYCIASGKICELGKLSMTCKTKTFQISTYNY